MPGLSPRIYLDNAATSWPKPPEVYAAVQHAMQELGAPAGRGSYTQAIEVERLLDDARRRVARAIGGDAGGVVFTHNCTTSLNFVIHGWLRPGDHVVTSVAEHNSVLRPLKQLEKAGTIEVTRVGTDTCGVLSAAAIAAEFRPNTRLLAVTQASNVTGAIQPVAEIGAAAAARGIPLLVDAAQTCGHLPIDVEQLQADFLAASGHKGLLGPLGTGVLWVRETRRTQLGTLIQGGTGTESDRDEQPEGFPYCLESGNPNVPGILGLSAGLQYLERRTIEAIAEHEQATIEQLLAGLAEVPSVQVYGPNRADRQVGVVSLTVEGYDPRELAGMLDSAFAIQTRAGFQCAPLMHRQLGTDTGGGTLRISPGPFTTTAQIDQVIRAFKELC